MARASPCRGCARARASAKLRLHSSFAWQSARHPRKLWNSNQLSVYGVTPDGYFESRLLPFIENVRFARARRNVLLFSCEKDINVGYWIIFSSHKKDAINSIWKRRYWKLLNFVNKITLVIFYLSIFLKIYILSCYTFLLISRMIDGIFLHYVKWKAAILFLSLYHKQYNSRQRYANSIHIYTYMHVTIP